MNQVNKAAKYSHKNNQELRKYIVSNTSMQEGLPMDESIKNPPILYQGSKPAIYNQGVSTSTERNMKFKLEQLQSKLNQLQVDVRGSRQECRELNNHISFLKNQLIYNNLYQMKADLDGKILGFSNQIRQLKEVNNNRYGQIRSDCGTLWQQTEKIRQQVFQLEIRVEKVELRLGFQQSLKIQCL